MPEFFDVARSQRGTRLFKSEPIPDDDLQQILRAAIRAPSGSNKQPWTFVVVRDRAVKQRLGELYLEGQTRSRGSAPPPPPAGEPVPFSHGMADVPVVVLACMQYSPGSGREAFRGASIYPAVQNLMLGAAALGIGSRLTTIWHHAYKEVADLLGVPDDWEIMALIPLGYPQEPDHLGGSKRRPVAEVTYIDHWGTAPSW